LQGSTTLTFAHYDLDISLHGASILMSFVSMKTRLREESVHIWYDP